MKLANIIFEIVEGEASKKRESQQSQNWSCPSARGATLPCTHDTPRSTVRACSHSRRGTQYVIQVIKVFYADGGGRF